MMVGKTSGGMCAGYVSVAVSQYMEVGRCTGS